ncbi:MAG: C10 family peptidase, partial [Fibromonadaceae bacterium]|jgi:hypothetical protein|nr:C10 family peptidase [Fibromonadaceae bacterium]
VLAAALLFLVSCGKHSFEDVFDSDIDVFSSSSNVEEPSSSSNVEEPSSSSNVEEPSSSSNVEEPSSSSNGNGTTPGIVGPLTQTKWGQGSPYRDMLPGQSRGGCVGVAIAQIMYFHRHPVQGSGQNEPYTSNGVDVPSVNFDSIHFDWNNMLNTYTNANPGTEQQRNAVASLFRYMAIGIGMHFGPDGTGGAVSTPPLTRGLTTFFGYDRSIQRLERRWYNDDDWETKIREQLDAGLPVFYFGENEMSDHAFVIDGYDNTGRFHINWGWNGFNDGWFFLNALNTDNGHWNHNQGMIINIKPDKGGASSNELALLAFAPEKNSVNQNEQFNVNANLRSIGFFPGGHVGAALVDNNGEIVEIIGMNSRATSSFNSLNPAGTRTVNISCYVPDSVNAGKYNLRIVIKPNDGDWQIVTLANSGIQNTVELTVNPYVGVSPGGGYGLSLEIFNVVDDKVSVSHGEAFSVAVRTRKIGVEAFPGGRLGVALVDNNGEIVEVIRDINWNTLNPGSGYRGQTINNITMPNTVPPGQYQLGIVVRPTGVEEWRLATLSLPGVPTSIDFTVE